MSNNAAIDVTDSVDSSDTLNVQRKPTVILVHGAFADASGWYDTMQLLLDDGFPVLAPAIPLRGVEWDAAYVASIVATITGPVILVGHSYGGTVITNAARRAGDVRALVYIAAFLNEEGECIQEANDPVRFPGGLVGQSTTLRRPHPEADETDVYMKLDVFHDEFAADLPRATTALMARAQRPLAASVFTEPSGPPAWKSLPSWALLATRDRAIPFAAQKYMADRAQARQREVESSHAVMNSNPEAVVTIVREAYECTRS